MLNECLKCSHLPTNWKCESSSKDNQTSEMLYNLNYHSLIFHTSGRSGSAGKMPCPIQYYSIILVLLSVINTAVLPPGRMQIPVLNIWHLLQSLKPGTGIQSGILPCHPAIWLGTS